MAAPRPYDEGGREAAAASFSDREERESGRRGKQRWPHSVLAMEEDVGPLPLCSATGGGIAVRRGKQQWSRSVLAMKEDARPLPDPLLLRSVTGPLPIRSATEGGLFERVLALPSAGIWQAVGMCFTKHFCESSHV